MLHEANGPLLERLGEDGVVREEERVADDVPGLVPRHLLLVDEHAHELGNRERRVGLRVFSVSRVAGGNSSRRLTSLSWIETSGGTLVRTRTRAPSRRHLTFGELGDVLADVLEAAHDVRETRSRPEVLLLQTELLSD